MTSKFKFCYQLKPVFFIKRDVGVGFPKQADKIEIRQSFLYKLLYLLL